MTAPEIANGRCPTKREAALAKPVADWLRANGYPAVYAEIPPDSSSGPIDLIGWDEAGDRVCCVELKRSLSEKVIAQAYRSQLITQEVYAAVGTKPKVGSIEHARKCGIGILAVTGDAVSVVCAPGRRLDPWRPYRNALIERLRKSTPSDNGGVPCLHGIGPAQDCSKAIRKYIEMHPGTDWRTIFAEVPNHYANFRSMAQVMNRRFGIFLKSEAWKREQWEYVQKQLAAKRLRLNNQRNFNS